MLYKTLIALLLTSLPAVAIAGEECPLPARECEAQIRQMLGERRYLGVRFEKTRIGIIIRSVVEGSPSAATCIRTRTAEAPVRGC